MHISRSTRNSLDIGVIFEISINCSSQKSRPFGDDSNRRPGQWMSTQSTRAGRLYVVFLVLGHFESELCCGRDFRVDEWVGIDIKQRQSNEPFTD